MVPSNDGGGYFMVASDGGVFAFGDARFEGSCPGIGGCSGAAVAVVPDATGNGYWVVTNTGAVYTFGDAVNYGQPGTAELADHVGRGHTRTAAATGSSTPRARCSPSATPPSLGGMPRRYGGRLRSGVRHLRHVRRRGLLDRDRAGQGVAYGDAPDDGDMSGTHLNGPIVAASGILSGRPPDGRRRGHDQLIRIYGGVTDRPLREGHMGIFQRAHDIVQAKTNKALDAAEKPDEMLDLSYEKMLEQITQVRRALVDLAASKKRLELQQEQFQHTVDHLQDQAKQALRPNREDLAKEALSRKAAAQQQIDEMEPQRQQLDEEEKKLTKTLDALQKRVNDFRTQKETLKAQYTAAKAISEVDESTAGISKSFNDSGAVPAAGPGQDRHHAGPLGRPRRVARIRRARGRRRRHRRHPEGARPGRQGRPGRQRAGRPQGAAGHRRPAASPTRWPPRRAGRRSRGVDAGPVVRPGECPRRTAPRRRPARTPPSSWRKCPAPCDRDVAAGRPRPGTCACSTSAQPAGAGIAVGERGEEGGRRSRPARRMVRRFRRAHSLGGVRPISSGSRRGPAQKVSSGNGAS